MLNKQEIFNKAVKAIVAQGCQSIDAPLTTAQCQYLMQDGRRCVIGWLLSDEQLQARPNMVRVSPPVNSLIDRPAWTCSLSYHTELLSALSELGVENEDDIVFLARLQQAHDEYSDTPEMFIEAFLESCQSIAVDYDLVMPDV